MRLFFQFRWLPLAGAALVVTMLAWGLTGAFAQAPSPQDATLATATVGSRIHFQGTLIESGEPVNGSRDMTFRLYSNSTCSVQVGVNIPENDVPIVDGMFTVALDLDQSLFDGDARWLEVTVETTELGCHEVLPVPYALSLRPGAEIKGEPAGWDAGILNASMTGAFPAGKAIWGTAATGFAVRGDSSGGNALFGSTADGYAIYGYDSGTDQARGYGGYFESDNGVSVFGWSHANSHYANMFAPGVYGRSSNGTGVYGQSDGDSWPAYGGYFQGRIGLSGHSTGPVDFGYGGSFTSANYRGLYARGDSGWYDAYFGGDAGISVVGDIRAGGDIIAGGSKAGYVSDIAVNVGPEPVTLGDVVEVVGVSEPVLGSIPVPQVRKAAAANSTAVIGIVDRKYLPVTSEVGAAGGDRGENGGDFVETMEVAAAGQPGIMPGEYVGVVTLGAFQAVKVDAAFGAIAPGDLLVASPTPGHAMRGENPPVGAVIGKALSQWAEGAGTIPVLVTLQ